MIRASLVTSLPMIAFLVSADPSVAQSVRAYVTNFGGDSITVIDLASNHVRQSIRTGNKPHGVAISHDGHRVYVSNEGDGTLSVIDPTTDSVLTTIAVGKHPHQVAVSPNDSLILIALNGEDALAVVDAIDFKTVRIVPVGRTPHIPITTTDGQFVYVTCEGDMKVSVVSLPTLEVVKSIPLVAFPRVPTFDAEGLRLYQTIRWLNGALVIDVAEGKIIDWIALGGDRFMAEGKHAHGVATRPASGELWVTSQADNSVSVVELSTGKLLTRIPTGTDPNWVDFTPDGRIAVVSNTADNSATIIDAKSHTVLKTVAVGSQPKRLAVGMFP